ncbi:hypothetical protein Pam3_32 [Pseudanabaena phage Pam3]|nr:hypothetical protein Pam3_32 [Pseudanabaena phage Pam3]
MSNVYVVQDHRRYDRDTGQFVPVHDLTPAKQYGELKYLLSPTAAPWNPQSILPELWSGLKNFCDDDYLLLNGNPILIGWATAVAADYNDGSVQLLQWNGKEGRYLPISAQVFPVADETARG